MQHDMRTRDGCFDAFLEQNTRAEELELTLERTEHRLEAENAALKVREDRLVGVLRGLLKSSDVYAQKAGWWPDNVSRSSARAIIAEYYAQKESTNATE